MKKCILVILIIVSNYYLIACSPLQCRINCSGSIKSNDNLACFNRLLEITLNAKSPLLLNCYLDKNAFWNRVDAKIKKYPSPPKVSGFLSQAIVLEPWSQLFNFDEENTSWALSHCRVNGNQIETLFRMDSDRIDYCLFYISETEEGYKIRDIFFYPYVSLFSDITADILYYSSNKSPGIKHRDVIKKINSIDTQVKNKEYPAAFENSNNISPEIMSSPYYRMKILFLKINAAFHLDKNKYLASIEEYKEYQKNTPESSYTLIHFFIEQGLYGNSLETLNKMEPYFLKDAGIYYLLSKTHLLKGDIDNALRTAYQAIKLDPYYEKAFWSLLKALLKENNHALALLNMKVMQQRFNIQFTTEYLSKNEIFIRFMESEEYKAWILEES